MDIPSPPKLSELLYGTILNCGLGTSTIIADFDFETYSPAGFIWDPYTDRFNCPKGSNKKGISAVGAAVYSQHPEAEVLCLAYNLKDGHGPKLWVPYSENDPYPYDLIDHIYRGRLLESWNAAFEYWVWNNICVPKYGFPILNPQLLRCAMAKSRAHALPGALDSAGKVLNLGQQKDAAGKRLLNKFSIPRNPTNKNKAHRLYLEDDPEDAEKLFKYCLQDIATEAEASSKIPDLTPNELEFWQYDQVINRRGVQIDFESVNACISIIEQAYAKYNIILRNLTSGQVNRASEVQKLLEWIHVQYRKEYEVNEKLICDLTDETIEKELVKPNLPPSIRKVLEIRQLLSSAAVKKLYAMQRQSTAQGRVHDIFIYHSARTGRAAGAEIQPQNLPSAKIHTVICEYCKKHLKHWFDLSCRWCSRLAGYENAEWNTDAVEDALETIKTNNLDCVENIWGNAIETISACIRGLIISAPNHDLMGSDYSAIEAVVLAALAGEEWRLDVFNTHGMIYEMSASKITGIPFEQFIEYFQREGKHHPMRKLGKVAELASGYQGGINAWKQPNFEADKFLTDDEIRESVKTWRRASPKIVEMWGGQERYRRPELFGLEGMAVNAVLNPGVIFNFRGIEYLLKEDILYCKLLSGRSLTYHKPRLGPSHFEWSQGKSLSFEGWNTNPKNGPIGWIRMSTYGGKLCENVVQATARDILAHAIVNLEKLNYPVVLHVHDEIVCEIPENFGSIEEMEAIMIQKPTWAENWPIKSSGGWRGKRYRKG